MPVVSSSLNLIKLLWRSGIQRRMRRKNGEKRRKENSFTGHYRGSWGKVVIDDRGRCGATSRCRRTGQPTGRSGEVVPSRHAFDKEAVQPVNAIEYASQCLEACQRYANIGKWLRDGSRNYVAEEARWRRLGQNMERSCSSEMQESHSGGKNRDWRDDGVRMGTNLGGGNRRLNPLEFNAANMIQNASLRLIASSKEKELSSGVNANTKQHLTGEIDDVTRKTVDKALEWESSQTVSNSLLVEDGPHTGNTQQAQLIQNSVHNNQGEDMGSFFIFSSSPKGERTCVQTKAWKKEA
ncbi:hypothetical protein SLEP1_g44922 [Rubroshorea leprosula]|uniref:Uncharacterized protein n=1 Tax=Rubroshorea leprosula TaxID=152421 RepID=A0AAV5LHJ8_9ROSI|nr:hypothetical protein SLEP1_g44922 [Rubroshorea leprosula]